MTRKLDKRNAEIVRLYKQGLTYAEIGARFCITRGVVAGVVRRSGATLHRPRSDVIHSADLCAEVAKLYQQGVPVVQIAARLSVPVGSICWMRSRAGVSANRHYREEAA